MHRSDLALVGAAIAAIGETTAGTALDALLRSVTDFDMSCVFGFHAENQPVVVHDGYSRSVSRQALQSYLRGGYLLDPFYVASVGDVREGLWRMSELAPDAFFDSDFAASREVHPCISDRAGTLVEEVGYVVALPQGWAATYSLMRNRLAQPFSSAELTALVGLAPVVSGVLRQHWRVTASSRTPDDGVTSALRRAFAPALTPAQLRVVELVLRGHSVASTARSLGITVGTAKLHRHNAYQRLGISSQAELFRIFIDSLEVQRLP